MGTNIPYSLQQHTSQRQAEHAFAHRITRMYHTRIRIPVRTLRLTQTNKNSGHKNSVFPPATHITKSRTRLRTVVGLVSQRTPAVPTLALLTFDGTPSRKRQEKGTAAWRKIRGRRKPASTRHGGRTFFKPERTPAHTLFQSDVSKRTKTDQKFSHFRP